MRWGLRNKQQQQPQEQEESKAGKSKGPFSSFSPFAWLSKLTAKSNAAKPKNAAPETRSNGGGFPTSYFLKRTTPSPGSRSSTEDSSPVAAVPDMAPRRLSVGNDDAEGVAAAARQLYRRRHFSVGGDRDLPPLSELTRFSRAASPQRTPPSAPTLTLTPPRPSDTDEEKRPRRRRRRSSARRSFSGRTPVARVAAVRLRSPRCSAAAVSGLERFAVVRRTRDPQREFRDSMVEMITSKRIGRPDELETLLACYLSLNADEHHDCIVKVFRQVWFDLTPPEPPAPPRHAADSSWSICPHDAGLFHSMHTTFRSKLAAHGGSFCRRHHGARVCVPACRGRADVDTGSKSVRGAAGYA